MLPEKFDLANSVQHFDAAGDSRHEIEKSPVIACVADASLLSPISPALLLTSKRLYLQNICCTARIIMPVLFPSKSMA